MTKSIKKIIAYILVVALLLSLMGCSSSLDEPTPNTSPEMEMPEGEFPEGEMPFGDMEGGFGGVMPEVTETPSATVSPGSGASVVVKEELYDANGVYLYSYDTVFTSTASNFVVIRMDDEALLSKDLFITEIYLTSYSGDADFDDEDIIPDIDDPIQINETTMTTSLFKAGYTVIDPDSDDQPVVDYLVALAREDDGDYYIVEYGTSGWQTVADGTVIDSDEEIYIGLPLYDSGSYEVQISFEIKDSQDAYNFGYFDKEVDDGEEFTLTASSKISKEKAVVYVKSEATAIDEDNDTDVIAQYILIDSSVGDIASGVSDYLSQYLTVEVDGEEDTNALYEFVKIVDISEVYAYIYNEDTINYSETGSTTRYVILSEESDLAGTSYDEDDEIEEGDLIWVNYEFTIYSGGQYVISESNAYSVTNYINSVFDIGYEDGDFIDGTHNGFQNSTYINSATSTYSSLSTAQKAYLESYTGTIKTTDSDYDDYASFVAWYKAKYNSAYNDVSYTGYDLIEYHEDAETFLDELEIIEAFETVLENYDLLFDSSSDSRSATFYWDGSYHNVKDTLMIEVNTGSTTQVNNLETVILYLDELSDDDREVIERRESDTYAYIEYLESEIITDDVEYVMSEISAVVASYLVSGYTNTLLYVDLETTASGGTGYVLDLDATHMVYSTSLFTSIENAYSSYMNLAPEKQDLLAKYTITVTNQGGTASSASSYGNYYYFNGDMISNTYNSSSTSFEITYKDAIFAMYEMMEITENLQTLFSYIDYTSYFDTDIAKDRYVDLVFGTSDEDYNHLMYGTGNSLFDYASSYDDNHYYNKDYEYNDPRLNWAIYDLAEAYGESEAVGDAIIAEYIDFIELLIYIEEYKLDIAEQFEDMMYEEISTSNDYSSKTVSLMSADLEDYIDAILEEDTTVIKDGMSNVITYIFSEGFDSIDEAKALVEECFDLDDMVDYMITAEGYEEE